MTLFDDAPALPAAGSPFDGRVMAPALRPPRGLLAQIEACRREVAQWPGWMAQERAVPDWMTHHATDL
jgi:hypothetical protein